jgi:hypothetical protein
MSLGADAVRVDENVGRQFASTERHRADGRLFDGRRAVCRADADHQTVAANATGHAPSDEEGPAADHALPDDLGAAGQDR